MAKKGKTARQAKARAGMGAALGPKLGNVHPLVQQAMASGAMLIRGEFEVTLVPNPFGEVIVRGEPVRHKAVRRVRRFETLYRSKVIDDHVFACLEWYDRKLAEAQASLFKCGIDTSGGGGSAQHHIPINDLVLNARDNVKWARGFVPEGVLRQVFDWVMDDQTFEEIGRAVFSHLSPRQAQRRASSSFQIAANHLLIGIGARVFGWKDAA